MKTNPVLLNRQSGKWTKLYAVESESRPGTLYYIGHSNDDQWACSCPAWIFHTPRRDCKHIRVVRSWIAGGAPPAPVSTRQPAAVPQQERASAEAALLQRAEEQFTSQRARFIELD